MCYSVCYSVADAGIQKGGVPTCAGLWAKPLARGVLGHAPHKIFGKYLFLGEFWALFGHNCFSRLH